MNVHLGTGNYNDATAKLYTDLGLLTCREDIGEDATAVFNMLSGYSEPRSWNKLSLAPLWLKDRFIYMIERETKFANPFADSLKYGRFFPLNPAVPPETGFPPCAAGYEASSLHWRGSTLRLRRFQNRKSCYAPKMSLQSNEPGDILKERVFIPEIHHE